MAKLLSVKNRGLETFLIARRERKERLFKVFSLLSIFLVLSLIILLPACRKTTPVPSPTPPALTTAAPTPTLITEGKNLYTEKCAACHGPNAEGTTVAPHIAGHSISAVKTQVRSPVGTMPAFPVAQLSDHNLDKIAEFIASLGKAEAPVVEWEKASTETMHYWMALLAIKGGDSEDAKHHLQDAMTFILKPRHKAEMEKILNLIAQGKIHDAEHEIEDMAGAESPSGITMPRFHLILAQRAVEAKSAAGVKHHLEHFARKATEAEKNIAQEALELVAKGDFHEAEHKIEELLEMSE